MTKIKSILFLILASFIVTAQAQNPPDYFSMRFCINPATTASKNALLSGDLPLAFRFTVQNTSQKIEQPKLGSSVSLNIPFGASNLINSAPDSTPPVYCTENVNVKLVPCSIVFDRDVCRFGSHNNHVTFRIYDLTRLDSAGNPIRLSNDLTVTIPSRGGSPQVFLINFPGYVEGNCGVTAWYATCGGNDYGTVCPNSCAAIDGGTGGGSKGSYSMNLKYDGNTWLQSP